MNCPACQRANAANRRFCGGCGNDLACVCGACAFQNTADDHYCGGCGVAFGAAPARPPAPPANTTVRMTVMPVAPSITFTSVPAAPSPPPPPTDEMAALFSAPPVELETQLPEAGIVQADVDRLFGVIS